MYRISKQFELNYAHQLHGLPDGHKCGRMHGHNGVVTVTLASTQLNQVGFIVDYGDLKPLGKWLDDTFDHRILNDHVMFQPSAENMARHVFDWCNSQGWPVESAAWSETNGTNAWYSE